MSEDESAHGSNDCCWFVSRLASIDDANKNMEGYLSNESWCISKL